MKLNADNYSPTNGDDLSNINSICAKKMKEMTLARTNETEVKKGNQTKKS